MNLIALQHAVRHTPAEYAAAPLDAFKQFMTQVEQLQTFAKVVREFADQACELRYAEIARQRRISDGRDFGAVRIDDQGETVVCDQRKIIDWDQAQLAELARKILDAGDDPAQYMDVSFKVPESKYSAWPQVLREQFEGARTVRPGKVSFKLASVDAALAAKEVR
ncbi:MAG: hypothetical protein ACTS6O_00145 [Giesbergeria sp.]